MISARIQKIKTELDPIRKQLVEHTVYAYIKTINDLQVFMEHHVYAVWDFMSLLKSLQKNVTCTDVPWVPVGSAETRYLINEIVIGEESDIDENGMRLSHFELYLNAMKQVGCNTTAIDIFIKNIHKKISLNESLKTANAPAEAKAFVQNTFGFINSGNVSIQASVFTFGREDLIPSMFISFVNELNKQTNNQISIMKYYLERHIEIDGDHHSHLAYKMTEELCGNDDSKWREATESAKAALLQRVKLWDAIAVAIKSRQAEMILNN